MTVHMLIARVFNKMARKKTCFDVLRKPLDGSPMVIRLHKRVNKFRDKGCICHNFMYFDIDFRRWREEEVSTRKGSNAFRVWAHGCWRGCWRVEAGVYEVSGPYDVIFGEPVFRLTWIDCPLRLAALEESR